MAVMGLGNFYIAPLSTCVDGTAPTYSTGMKVGELMKADITLNRATAKLYGDNRLVDADNSITGGSITMGTTYVSVAARKMMLGEENFNTATGSQTQEIHTVDDATPYVGCGFVIKKKEGGSTGFEAYWYWKVQFAMDDSYETKGENVNFGTPELKGEMLLVAPKADLKGSIRKYAEFTTEAAAVAWVKAMAGVSSST